MSAVRNVVKATRERVVRARWTIVAGLVALVVYELTREPGVQTHNQYVHLARALLEGRVDLLDAGPWHEGAAYQGKFYSHQGVLPGILLIPFVALFGPDINLRHFAVLLGVGISMTAWSLAGRLGLTGIRRIAGWAFPVFGTTIWFEAKAGSTWGVAALSSVLFLFLALREYYGSQRLGLVGLFIGLACLSRPPAILAVLGFVIAVRRPRRVLQLALGTIGPVLVMLLYNFARFGTIIDKSQELHYQADGFRLRRPPGQFSVRHIPFNLYSWIFLGPQSQDEFPFLRPTIMGTSLPLTSPAFVSALASKRDRWLWVCAVGVVMPAALHYANGFVQFGMRYLLDTIPFLSALIFLALKDDRAHGYRVLLIASIVLNAIGVYYTTNFDLKP